MGTWTRKTLRQRIGGPAYLGDMISSTASAQGAAAGATLIDTKLVNTDDTFNFGELVVLTGTYAGDYRYVNDWVQSTGTFTPDRAFTGLISSAVEYEVHRRFSATDKNSAINQAILDAKWRWPRLLESEVIEFETNTYRYRLVNTTLTNAITSNNPTNSGTLTVGDTGGFPASGWVKIDNEYIEYSAIASGTTFTLAASGARGANSSTAASHSAGASIGVCPDMDRYKRIDHIYYDTGLSGTGPPWSLWDDDYWEVRDDNGQVFLQLNTYPPQVNKHARLIYRARPAQLSADTGTLDPDVEPFAAYVCARATAILCQLRSIDEGEATKDFWQKKFEWFQALADGLMSQDAPVKQPGSVIYPAWGDTDTGNARVDTSLNRAVNSIHLD